MTDYADRLRKADWSVREVPLSTAQKLVRDHHYARGGSNTRTYTHGLFYRKEEDCRGVAWWIPPTKGAALAVFPADWRAVLALSRLVVVPGVPKNACSFLLAKSVKLIARDRWPCLVTYSDDWRGHKGTIYLAANWKALGRTAPKPTFVLDGRMVACKAGPKTRTRAEMKALGAEMVGLHAKNRFANVVFRTNAERYAFVFAA